jgi:hypothetical protein
MPADLRLRRCAGVIMWHMTHTDPNTGAPNTEDSAVAKASLREPELTDDQLAYCLDWARAGLLYRELANTVLRKPKLTRLPDGTLKIDHGPDGPEKRSLHYLLRASGLDKFIEDNRDA